MHTASGGLRIARIVAILLGASVSTVRASDATFEWVSRNLSRDQIGCEFARLYTALGALTDIGVAYPTVETKVDQELSDQNAQAGSVRSNSFLESVLRVHGQLFGPVYPKSVDRAWCKLNSTLCSLDKSVKLSSNSEDCAGVPSGANVSWTVHPNDKLVVPHLAIRPIVLNQSFSKSRGQAIEDILRRRGGCAESLGICRRQVQILSGDTAATTKDYSGEIVVPTVSYTARISLVFNFTGARNIRPDEGLLEWLRDIKEAASQPDAKLASQALAALEIVDSRVVAPIQVQFNGSGNTPSPAPSANGDLSPSASWDQVLKLVGVKEGINALLPGGPVPVVVGVMDGSVEAAHCGFQDGGIIQWSIENQKPQPPVQVVNAGQPCPMKLKKIISDVMDHGTHVTGLIAAKLGATDGPGVFFAARHIVTFPFSKAEMDNVQRGAGIPKYVESIHVAYKDLDIRPRIMNVSSGYNAPSAGQDFLETNLFADSNLVASTLFVVGAGNSSQSFDRKAICQIRPACLSQTRENILSVIGLDLDATRPRPLEAIDNLGQPAGSNRGEAFDIGAPGSSIISTVTDNQLGEMSGSSQATAIVSGAAGLLASLKEWRPGEIKNRLIYTSDLPQSLEQLSFGGRLNVYQALYDSDKDVVSKSDGTTTKGRINEREQIYVGLTDINPIKYGSGQRCIPLTQIRRLHRRSDGTFWVFQLAKFAARSGSPLKKRLVQLDGLFQQTDCGEKIVPQLATIHVLEQAANSAGTTVPVPINQIQDYFAPMEDPDN